MTSPAYIAVTPAGASAAAGVAVAIVLAWLATTFAAEDAMSALPVDFPPTVDPVALRDVDLPAHERGRVYYAQLCVSCHGVRGDGQGEWAYRMKPRPADLASARVVRHTDTDLERILREGLPGTAMPGWQRQLSDAQRRDVIAFVRSFGNTNAGERSH